MVSDITKHYPVLLNEIISIITPQHGGTFIDCTFGQGGYSKKILSYKNTYVIALDRDIKSKKKADEISKKFSNRLLFKNKKFSQLDNLKLKDREIRGIIFDLGYSLTQMKDPEKGLSFNSIGELNMQLGLNDFSASDVINKLDVKELEKIFKFFGDEKEAKKISLRIAEKRKNKKLVSSDLVEIIEKVKKRKNSKIHNATKVFQSLRIFVNKEISELIFGLIAATKVLKKNGILAVVTFHSLEDKIVKYFFNNFSQNRSKPSRYLPEENNENFVLFEKYINKVIKPTVSEIKKNNPSRSAKLRFAVRSKNNFFYPENFLKKFNRYLDIENLHV